MGIPLFARANSEERDTVTVHGPTAIYGLILGELERGDELGLYLLYFRAIEIGRVCVRLRGVRGMQGVTETVNKSR